MSTRLRFWLITLTALASFVITLSLGRWQLSRAAEKEGLQAAIEAQGKRTMIDNAALIRAPDANALIHRIAKLRGTWAQERTVFLDNRQMNAKPGFYVLTPLLLEGTSAAVMVQRGWVARNFVDRGKVSAVPTPLGVVELEGRIAPPPSKLYEMGDTGSGLIRQNLDLVRFKAETGLPLMAVSIQQTGSASEGLLREWPVVGPGSEKNYGYAFQWFGLSALIAILYVWFQIGKRFFTKRRA